MNCKEFEEKLFGIGMDDLSLAERQELKKHQNECTEDHSAVNWMLEELNFNSPVPANPERLTQNIMQAVSAEGNSRSWHLNSILFRYVAAIVAIVLSAAFTVELTRTPSIGHLSESVIKSESNAAFIKRVRKKPKATGLIAEIRACQTLCINPLSQGCEECLNLLNNLNNNSK